MDPKLKNIKYRPPKAVDREFIGRPKGLIVSLMELFCVGLTEYELIWNRLDPFQPQLHDLGKLFFMVHILDILELFILICIPPYNKSMYSGSVWSCNCKWRGSPEKLVSDEITCCLFSGVT